MSLETISVLLIEDNPGDARLLGEALREAERVSIHLTHHSTLLEAIGKLAIQRFDIILLDMSLPDADGLETLVRVHTEAPTTPIIVLTGYDDEALAIRAVREGAQDYLVKGQVDSHLLVRSMRYATERKRAVEALQRSEEYFRALIENALDLIAVLTATASIGYASPSFERVLGYSAYSLVGQSILLLTHPDDRDLLLSKLTLGLSMPDVSHSFEFRIRHRDGSWRVLEVISKRLDSPELSGLVLNARDTTERKHLEQQFRQSQKMEAVGRLAGGVAHDFNNLLTVISGSGAMAVRMLQETYPRKDRIQVYIEEMMKAADAAAEITSQILSFSRQQIVQPKVIDLNTLIAEMELMLRRLVGEDIELQFQLSPNLGRIKVDSGQIRQVVVNLVVNARDAMPHGGQLTIGTSNAEFDQARSRVESAPQPGPYVMLEVKDSGIGMTPETLSHLFEPFFTTKERGRGTGLGLSTSYGIIKQNRGEILSNSEPGLGTTFKIYLPRVDEPLDLVVKPTDLPSSTGTETILVVEDEHGVRRILVDALQDQGYNVLAAENGSDAIRSSDLFRNPIQLLITDVVMPRMNGRELADKLREVRPEMRVLFVSGYTDNEIAHHGVLDSGTHFLQKPFTPEALTAKVRAVLDS